MKKKVIKMFLTMYVNTYNVITMDQNETYQKYSPKY